MVAAIMQRPGRRVAPLWERAESARVESARVDLSRAAYETVAHHSHFRGRAGGFQFVQHEDGLIVRGSVPSFYLKQVLQTALMRLDGVQWLDNQVNVVCCNGLSSVSDG